jgi:hypothetical protein
MEIDLLAGVAAVVAGGDGESAGGVGGDVVIAASVLVRVACGVVCVDEQRAGLLAVVAGGEGEEVDSGSIDGLLAAVDCAVEGDIFGGSGLGNGCGLLFCNGCCGAASEQSCATGKQSPGETHGLTPFW